MTAVRVAVFDMDGLLIDSEPLWRRAEVEVFGAVGVGLTEAMCVETTGLRIDEVVTYWHARRPFTGASREDVAARIVDRLIALVREEGRAMPGATRALDLCRDHGLRLALASSSADRLIDAVLEHLGLRERFEIAVSAQHERYGKPHPSVFLTTAERLDVEPGECLVFEDSINGVLAAKSARMRCVAVPEPALRGDPRFGIADRVLHSLTELDAPALASLLS